MMDLGPSSLLDELKSKKNQNEVEMISPKKARQQKNKQSSSPRKPEDSKPFKIKYRFDQLLRNNPAASMLTLDGYCYFA